MRRVVAERGVTQRHASSDLTAPGATGRVGETPGCLVARGVAGWRRRGACDEAGA